MIKLKNITKSYPVGGADFFALSNVNLDIEQGEFVAVCGASGSGKTTLLNIIGCLDESTSGEYFLNDVSIEELPDSKKSKIRNEQIGFVLQDFALINSQTVLYNVMLPLLFSDTKFSRIRRKAKQALKLVGISDQAKKKANQLSGGQRQRVAIARAIVNSPSLILADEPTGQLDSRTSVQIMEILQELNKQGITVVVVTHDERVASYADRVITVVDGKIV